MTIDDYKSDHSDIYQAVICKLDTEEAIDVLAKHHVRDWVVSTQCIGCLPKKTYEIEKYLVENFGVEKMEASGLLTLNPKTQKKYFSLYAHRLVIPTYAPDNYTPIALEGMRIDGNSPIPYRKLKGSKTFPYNSVDLYFPRQTPNKHAEFVYQSSSILICGSVIDALIGIGINKLPVVGYCGECCFGPKEAKEIVDTGVENKYVLKNYSTGLGFYNKAVDLLQEITEFISRECFIKKDKDGFYTDIDEEHD